MQPRIQFRRTHLVGAIHVDDVDQPQLPAGHRHLRLVRAIGTRDIGPWQVMADDVGGGHIGEHGRRDAPLAVLFRRDDRSCRRPPLAHNVEFQLDRTRTDHDRTGEDSGHRANRLLRKAFGHSDNRLSEHLCSLDDLTIILTRRARIGGEFVLAVGLHVEQVEQALNGPGRLR